MKTATHILSEVIEETLDRDYRQYLVGDLKKPQQLQHIPSGELEIGMSKYTEFSHDTPHWHSESTEFLYILEGEFHIRLLDDGRDLILKRGDFFALPPGTPYASKTPGKTRVLFIKSKAKNDKQTAEVDEALEQWLCADPKFNRKESNNVSLDQLINLLSVYNAEWSHRDKIMWSISFRLFIAALTVIILPYLAVVHKVELPIDEWWFPLLGVLFAIYFLIVSLSYAVRLSAAGDSVANINKLLPSELQRERVAEQNIPLVKKRLNSIFNIRIAYWAPVIMFVLLLFLAILVFCITKKGG